MKNLRVFRASVAFLPQSTRKKSPQSALSALTTEITKKRHRSHSVGLDENLSACRASVAFLTAKG